MSNYCFATPWCTRKEIKINRIYKKCCHKRNKEEAYKAIWKVANLDFLQMVKTKIKSRHYIIKTGLKFNWYKNLMMYEYEMIFVIKRSCRIEQHNLIKSDIYILLNISFITYNTIIHTSKLPLVPPCWFNLSLFMLHVECIKIYLLL